MNKNVYPNLKQLFSSDELKTASF